MISWIAKVPPKTGLRIALILAVLITALSDIEESIGLLGFYPGHEVGTFVSELAFAFVGAYMFNWLIVEVPKNNAYRGYYGGAWQFITSIVDGPRQLIFRLYDLAGEDSRIYAEQHDLRRLLMVTDWSQKLEVSSGPRLSALVDDHRRAFRNLMPILTGFEPPVAVALSAINALGIDELMEHLSEEVFPRGPVDGVLAALIASRIRAYDEATNELVKALKESDFRPDKLSPLRPPLYRYFGEEPPV